MSSMAGSTLWRTDAPMRLDCRSLSLGHPFVVELDLGVDERQRLGASGNVVPHAGLMRREQGATLLQRGTALFHERRIVAQLCDRHAGASQPVHEVEPAYMILAVTPPPAAVACNSMHQALCLVPADGMNTAARSARDLSDSQGFDRSHGDPLKEAPAVRELRRSQHDRAYSRSRANFSHTCSGQARNFGRMVDPKGPP